MMTLQQVAEWTKGEQFGADVRLSGVSTDTRTLKKGDLFVALKGERFNAHDFLVTAQEAGASAVVVSEPQDVFTHGVQVPDTTMALGHLGAAWAQSCKARPIAITGNSGKTTVKEMVACLLAEQSCLATQGNFNNEIGVPLTLLRLTPEHQYGVYELGANHKGEIAWTASLVQPEVGVITNVTGAHLEGFGSLEGIAAAKAELIGALTPQGALVLNQEGGFFEVFQTHAQQKQVPIVRVSFTDKGADYFADDICINATSTSFRCHHQGEWFPMTVSLPGEHQVANALQAIAVARYYGVEWAQIQTSLAALKGVPGRLQLQQCGAGRVIDDTYNANPGSVAAALAFLVTQPGPHLFVFGGIGELGTASQAEHRRVGELARELGVDALITVGELPQPTAEAFAEGALQCPTTSDVAPFALSTLAQGGTVLVKGSRSTKMETVVAALLAHQQEAH